MGLDTSHDCWHGPYSQFMRFREGLAQLVTPKGSDRSGIDLRACEQYNGTRFNLADMFDEDDPLLMFFCHSDCDGEIAAELCNPLADSLFLLLNKMPERGIYDWLRPATLRFIRGLRLAASRGEAVVFS